MKIIQAFALSMFLLLAIFDQLNAQTYPAATIEEIQFVLNPGTNDVSFFLGDTVEVRALVTSDVRSLVVGDRWACFVVDPTFPSDPWQGFFIIQNDSTISNTLFGTVQPGMICRFTGVVNEFESFTQLTLLTDPLVPVVIESVGNILPAPIVLGTDELTDRANGEQWEGQFVQIANAEITNNAATSNRAVIQDSTGMPTFMDDYFWFFREKLDNSTYSWPANGSMVEVTGFVRGLVDGYSVNPRNFDDLIAISGGPMIIDVLRNPAIPSSSDNVTVSATITDNGTVTSAAVNYSIDQGPWLTAAMSVNGDTWSGDIPQQSDASFLRYFVSATDNEGFITQFPEDTSQVSGSVFHYVVRDNGLLIADVQNTYGYGNDVSGYLNYTVTVEGVVMSSPAQFPGYFIQDAADAWSGIFARNSQSLYQIGDYVRITGTIEEDFGWTKIHVLSDTLITPNFGAFSPVPQQTGNLATGGPLAEAFESVFVSFSNVTVTNAFPHFPNNFGEFIVDDGSGGMFVDDESELYDGNLWSAIENGAFGYIQGIHAYTFSEFKLEPRDSNDVDLIVGIEDVAEVPRGFELKQNYPNPFNPTTTIEFILPVASVVTLEIFNVMGQRVETHPVETHHDVSLQAGNHKFIWDATDATGHPVASGIYFYRLVADDYIQNRKMILIR